MFYDSGPCQVFICIEENPGKTAIIGKALNWDGSVVNNVLAFDSGRFFVKYQDAGPGVVVEIFPSLSNRCVNIHGGKLRCAALVYRTFTKREPSVPLL